MVEDIVRELGYTTLGSRLKRIGERLQADTQEMARLLAGKDLPTPYNPVLAAIDRNGPLSISDLSACLGQSQPGVTRMIGKMKTDGFVETRAGETDRRVSTVHLTPAGQALTEHLKTAMWPHVETAVADACSKLGEDFLSQLTQLEEALAERPLAKRIPR